ncbi:MAG: glycosyltransferase family 2 protein [Lachnospiraceae bacterium]|nr:glycosyltransferase family 2 protein [Lachnospiraceae bacterium]
MDNRPLISVIIPVYNVESYLDKCINSVLNQTYPDLEIILVDDGSTDSSGRLCDDYGKKDGRVRVIHKKNGGLMSAWMAGVREAKGEYFSFVDSDDWIELNMFEELAALLSGNAKEMVCSNYLIEKPNASVPVIQSMKPGVYERKAIEEELFPHLLGEEVRRIHSSRCMKLISRDLILENLKFCNPALTMGEDMNIILPAILDAERIVVMEKGLYYHYRFVDSSMAHKYNPRLYEKVYLLYYTLQKVLEGKKAEKQMLKNLKKEYIFLLFLVMKNELRGPKEGCNERLKEMIEEAREEEELRRIRVSIRGKANLLLYFIWKNPSPFRIALGRRAIEIFDGRTKG